MVGGQKEGSENIVISSCTGRIQKGIRKKDKIIISIKTK
jgi:hypothetical protein